MIWPLFHPLLQLIFWLHMAINPIQVIQVNTANQATVLDALRSTHNVKTGFVCSSPRDIVCVDRVCNSNISGYYWTIEVNGEYETVNSQTLIQPSDQVVLKYASSIKR